MSRIKIVKTDCELNEAELNEYESQGLMLISANHVTTEEYRQGLGPESFKYDVVRWTYHFRETKVTDETKRCVDIIMSSSVPGKYQVLLREAILAEEN